MGEALDSAGRHCWRSLGDRFVEPYGPSKLRVWGTGTAVALLTLGLGIAAAEWGLRRLIFDYNPAPGTTAAWVQNVVRPSNFAWEGNDAYWILWHYTNRAWRIAPEEQEPVIGSNFYDDWSRSLQEDSELGYVRRKSVTAHCHETTSLGTRGTREYSETGKKILFFGSSFIESNACSRDTITAKMERLSGIDVLNFGVGGYALDQTFLSFQREAKAFAAADALHLIAITATSQAWMLLSVRSSPKPYLATRGGELVMHAEHIVPGRFEEFFQKERPRLFYLLRLLKTRLGSFPPHRSKGRFPPPVAVMSDWILREIVKVRAERGLRVVLVDLRIDGSDHLPITELARNRHIPVVSIDRSCGRVADAWEAGHPTPPYNQLLAECLLRRLPDRDRRLLGLDVREQESLSPRQ